MKTNLKLSKQRHQVKSRWYYIFWGSATLSVFVGQLYVGSGYRQMSESFNRMLDEPITIIDLSNLPWLIFSFFLNSSILYQSLINIINAKHMKTIKEKLIIIEIVIKTKRLV